MFSDPLLEKYFRNFPWKLLLHDWICMIDTSKLSVGEIFKGPIHCRLFDSFTLLIFHMHTYIIGKQKNNFDIGKLKHTLIFFFYILFTKIKENQNKIVYTRKFSCHYV